MRSLSEAKSMRNLAGGRSPPLRPRFRRGDATEKLRPATNTPSCCAEARSGAPAPAPPPTSQCFLAHPPPAAQHAPRRSWAPFQNFLSVAMHAMEGDTGLLVAHRSVPGGGVAGGTAGGAEGWTRSPTRRSRTIDEKPDDKRVMRAHRVAPAYMSSASL